MKIFVWHEQLVEVKFVKHYKSYIDTCANHGVYDEKEEV